jgi:hypothetical protein
MMTQGGFVAAAHHENRSQERVNYMNSCVFALQTPIG